MTLLDSITRAAAAADAGELSADNELPIVLNADSIFPYLKPDSGSTADVLPVVRVSGWAISQTDSDIIEITSKFSKSLRKKLKRSKSLERAKFFKRLSTFLRSVGEKLGIPLDLDTSNPYSFEFSRYAVEKVGFYIGRDVAGLVAEVCLVLELWELLETLIVNKLVDHLHSVNLMEKLVDQNHAKLICLCVKHITDLRPSDILSVLRFFLSPPPDAYTRILEVKNEWETQALLAIKTATKKTLPKKLAILAKDASILLMLAHDSFSPSESCLHYVFSTPNIDKLVFSSVISKLNGREILALMRYLVKWMKKYERFPEAGPCLQAKSALTLNACEDVPPFESIVKALGLVLDEHFSYLVLNAEFHDELRAMQEVVNGLVSEADESAPVDCVLKHLKSQFNENGNQRLM